MLVPVLGLFTLLHLYCGNFTCLLSGLNSLPGLLFMFVGSAGIPDKCLRLMCTEHLLPVPQCVGKINTMMEKHEVCPFVNLVLQERGQISNR